MRRKTNKLWLAVLATVCMAACNQGTLYNQYREIDAKGWHQDSVLVFEADVQDTVSACDLMVQVRHTDRYPFQNFWMFIDSESPAGIVQKDTIECYLADNSGRWLGQRYFSLHEMQVQYLCIKHFPMKGVYRFRISQAMREPLLPGIESIGLSIQKNGRDGEE